MKTHAISHSQVLFVRPSLICPLSVKQPSGLKAPNRPENSRATASYSLLNYSKGKHIQAENLKLRDHKSEMLPLPTFNGSTGGTSSRIEEMPINDEIFLGEQLGSDFLECLQTNDIRILCAESSTPEKLQIRNQKDFKRLSFKKTEAPGTDIVTNTNMVQKTLLKHSFEKKASRKHSYNSQSRLLDEPVMSSTPEDKLKIVENCLATNSLIVGDLIAKEPEIYRELIKQRIQSVDKDMRLLQDIFGNELRIVRSVKCLEAFIDLHRTVTQSINHNIKIGLTVWFKYPYEPSERNLLIGVRDEKGFKANDLKMIHHLVENFDRRADRNWTLAFEFVVRIIEIIEKITEVNLMFSVFDVRKKEEEQKALITEDQESIDRGLDISTSNHKLTDPNNLFSEEAERIKKQRINNALTQEYGSSNASPTVKHEFSYEYLNCNEENFSRYKSDFEEIQLLGSGGFGAVYKVRNRLDGNYYAVKIIFFGTSEARQSLKSVLQEVKLLSKLNHPHIVRYYQAWIEDGDFHEELKNQFYVDDSSESGSQSYDYFTDSRHDQSKGSDGVIALNAVKNSKDLTNNEFESYENFNKMFLKNCAKKDYKLEMNNDYHWKQDDDDFVIAVNDGPENGHDKSEENSSPREEEYQSGLVISLHSKNKPKDQDKAKVLFIQMEFCENQTLKEHLEMYSIENNDVIIRKFLIQIVDALHYLHSQGFIHRDLKPSNIFLDYQMNIKLGDLGLAKQTGMPLEGGRTSTSRGFNLSSNVGTPIYMSPEQNNSGNYNDKSDMYSLGVVLFELLMYKFTTDSERIRTLEALLIHHKLPPFLDSRKNNELVKIMLKLIENNPEKRLSSSDLYMTFQDSLYQEHIISNISEYRKIIDYVFNKRGNFIKAKDHQVQTSYEQKIVANAANINEAYLEFLIQSSFKKYFVDKVETTPLVAFEDQVNIISAKFAKNTITRSFKSLSHYIDIYSLDSENLFIDKNAAFNYMSKSPLVALSHAIKFTDKEFYRCFATSNPAIKLPKNDSVENQSIAFMNYLTDDKLSKEMVSYYQAENVKILYDILSQLLHHLPDAQLIISSSFLFDMLFEKIKLGLKSYTQFFGILSSFHTLPRSEFLKYLQETLNLDYKKNQLVYQFLNTAESDLATFRQKLLLLCPNDPLIDHTLKDLVSLEKLLTIFGVKGLRVTYATYPPLENHFPFVYSGYNFWLGNRVSRITNQKGPRRVPQKNESQQSYYFQTIAVGGRLDNIIARGSSYFDNSRFATGFILYKKPIIQRLNEVKITRITSLNYLTAKENLHGAFVLVLASFSEPLFEEKLRVAAGIWSVGLKVQIYFEEMQSFERLIKISKEQNIWLIVILKPGIFAQHHKVKIRLVQKDLEKDIQYEEFRSMIGRKIASFDEFIKNYTNDFNIIEGDK
jgi:serine/threonine protein kinase